MTPHYNYEGNEADGKKVKEFLSRNKEIEALIFIKPFRQFDKSLESKGQKINDRQKTDDDLIFSLTLSQQLSGWTLIGMKNEGGLSLTRRAVSFTL